MKSGGSDRSRRYAARVNFRPIPGVCTPGSKPSRRFAAVALARRAELISPLRKQWAPRHSATPEPGLFIRATNPDSVILKRSARLSSPTRRLCGPGGRAVEGSAVFLTRSKLPVAKRRSLDSGRTAHPAKSRRDAVLARPSLGMTTQRVMAMMNNSARRGSGDKINAYTDLSAILRAVSSARFLGIGGPTPLAVLHCGQVAFLPRP